MNIDKKFLFLLSAVFLPAGNAFSQPYYTTESSYNYTYDSTEYVTQKKLGGSCSNYESRPCTIINSYCDYRSEICTCDSSYVADMSRNECLLKANQTGDSCEADIQCSVTLTSNGKCGPNKTCVCTEGSVRNSDGTECTMGEKFFDEVCLSSKDCIGFPDKAECLNGICQCKSGLAAASNNKTLGCLPVINRMGDVCQDSNQCQQGTLGKWSECEACYYSRDFPKQCMCPETTIVIPLVYGESEVCYKKAEKIGDSCELEEQCQHNLGELAECSSDGQCVCSNSSSMPTPDGSRCIPTQVSIGSKCQLHSQCVGKTNVTSACGESEICLCKEGLSQIPT